MQPTSFKAVVNGGAPRDVQLGNDAVTVNGHSLDWDCAPLGNNRFNILSNGKSYDAYVISLNREEKTIELLVNQHRYTVQLKDRYDDLLQQLGMNNDAAGKPSELKAPMPGMILKFLVREGDTVAKGDSLAVLEAMKMENMLKAQGNGVVKRIHAQPGTAVEKGAVLITFG